MAVKSTLLSAKTKSSKEQPTLFKKSQFASSDQDTTTTATTVGKEFLEEARIAAREVAQKVAQKVAEDTVKKEVEKRQVEYTEVLGVFVALFTFVSINFQVFRQIDTLNYAVFIILLIFLCLAWFIFLLDSILKGKNYAWGPIKATTAVVIFLLLIMLTLVKPREISPFLTQLNESILGIESRIEKLEEKSQTEIPPWINSGK